MQRWVRSVLEPQAPAELVFEKLNFVAEDSGLGWRMNRLLRGFGQRVFKQCVKNWGELKGFVVTEVETAYSSQMCSSCGFVHRTNRKGNSFGCLLCGHLAHIDVNAAKNLRRRSASGAFMATGGRNEWWTLALREWLARLRAGLLKALPGSTLHSRFVWRARTRTTALLKEKRSPVGAAQKLIQEFAMTLDQVVKGNLCKTIEGTDDGHEGTRAVQINRLIRISKRLSLTHSADETLPHGCDMLFHYLSDNF